MINLSRRAVLVTFGIAAATAPFAARIAFGQYALNDTKKMVLNDPAAPVGGNPKGDVTIVAYSDYNCPFCKKSAPDLERIVREDGNIRLIYKDWPILTPSSSYGAKLALAAKYQGKYETAHNALMGIFGRGVLEARMLDAIKETGIDMAQLEADMKTHADDIDALLARTMAQADTFGFQGTPTYLIGPFETSTLDFEGFKRVVADARARQAAK
jgi:protein-disulfide isomerase